MGREAGLRDGASASVHLVNISEKLAKYFKRNMFVLRLSAPTSPASWRTAPWAPGQRAGGVDFCTSLAKLSVREHFIYL